MQRLPHQACATDFVVVDNGSTDATSSVLRHFSEQLPLRCLEERVPGKSHALNRALGCVELAPIVVFTDDDITPNEGWLAAIAAACRRWQQHSTFGGPIALEWPAGWDPPAWAHHEILQSLVFARHEFGNDEQAYPPTLEPFGGNFWVRREAISELRFEADLGAHPTRQRNGEETYLLRELRARTGPPIFVPTARVVHRIPRSRTRERAVYRRAIQGGRGKVAVFGLPDPELHAQSRWRWQAEQLRKTAALIHECARGMLSFDETRRVLSTTPLLYDIAERMEALRLSVRRPCVARKA
jgi:glycosyltransferase involved in cell wall biosynthesis